MACHILGSGAVPRDMEACLGLTPGLFRGNVGYSGACVGPRPGPCQGDVRGCPSLARGTVACHVLGLGAVPRDMGTCLGLTPGPFRGDVRACPGLVVVLGVVPRDMGACLSHAPRPFRGDVGDSGECLGPKPGPCWVNVRACPGLSRGTVTCHVLSLGAVPRDMGACLSLGSGLFGAI